jgi:hypothetical protein
MGRTLRAIILLLTLPGLLAGCGLLAKWFTRKPKPDKHAGARDVWIGSIEMVNPEQRFVLVQTGMKLNLQPGWKLETRPVSGARSVLTVSPEQKLNFLSADITEGYPQKGELVVLPPQAGAGPTAPPEQPAPPASPATTGPTLPPPIP